MRQQKNCPQKLPSNSFVLPPLIHGKPGKAEHRERIARKASTQLFGDFVGVD